MNDRTVRRRKTKMLVEVVEDELRRWDPIGVSPGQGDPGENAPLDEYDSYAGPILSLLAEGCSVDELTLHLETTRKEMMGDRSAWEGDRKCAVALVEWWKRDGEVLRSEVVRRVRDRLRTRRKRW